MKFKFPDLVKPKDSPPPPPPTPGPKPVNPPHRSRRPHPDPEPVEETPNEFGQTLESLLGNKYAKSVVSEEELYAALLLHQIKQKFGDDHFEQWKSYFKLISVDNQRGDDREYSAEKAANETMKLFVESKLITSSEAKDLKSTAFELAQLDDRADVLWDKYGGDTDNTRSVARFARAQKIMQERLEELGSSQSVRGRRGRHKMKKISAVG